MNDMLSPQSLRNPIIYLIDDSATMREVVRIAFQREKMEVVTCPDAATAIERMEETKPDVVITDVIMPDKDGYEVCEFIKQHPDLNRTPVVLLSGVVDREVAEKAFRVKADELIRKPFLPQDLIARVRQLLTPKAPASPEPSTASSRTASLGDIFTAVASARRQPSPGSPPAPMPGLPQTKATAAVSTRLSQNSPGPAGTEVQRQRVGILRLENLVKKLQSELAAEREYARALEAHIKTLQDME